MYKIGYLCDILCVSDCVGATNESGNTTFSDAQGAPWVEVSIKTGLKKALVGEAVTSMTDRKESPEGRVV